MKITTILKQVPRLSAFMLSVSLLSACGSDSSSENSNSGESTPVSTGDYFSLPDGQVINQPSNPQVCTEADGTTINIEALLSENCNKLSDYNLFSDSTDPTSGPNGSGLPFKLNTPLFTDYASKYRFVFIPDGEVATYSEHEVMDFPVGTVLVKTFTLPADTANRDGAETIIETRLLINRESGWKALPYYWDTETDAHRLVSGAALAVSLTHNNETIAFDYGIPQQSQCTACHGILTDGSKKFLPIGPKARYLNWDIDYGNGTPVNQLTKWSDEGILTGLPDVATISTAATYSDSSDPTFFEPLELELAARSYLDINCAHCHRAELTLPEGYSGAAGGSGLNVEFNRNFDESTAKFGVCKSAVAGGHEDYPYDIIPGYPEQSYLLYRMNTLSSRHKMPELGRSSIHTEGVALISEWIKEMPANNCGVTDL